MYEEGSSHALDPCHIHRQPTRAGWTSAGDVEGRRSSQPRAGKQVTWKILRTGRSGSWAEGGLGSQQTGTEREHLRQKGQAIKQALRVSADRRKVPIDGSMGNQEQRLGIVRKFCKSWESLTASPLGANLSI